MLLASTRGLPRAFWLVWAGMLVNKLGTFVVPFLALYVTQERGFSVAQAGIIGSLFGAGSLSAAGIGGWLTDRIGRRSTMALGLVLGAVAIVHLAVARSFFHVGAATLVLGVVGDLYRPAMSAFTSDVVPPHDRARAYGLMYWAINLGFSISPIVGGLLAGKNFYLLFALDAATNLVFAAIVWFWVPESRPAEARAAPRVPVLAVLGDGVFVGFVAVNMLVALIFFQHISTLPLDMQTHGLHAPDFGLLISMNGILIILLQPPLGHWLERFHRARVLAVSAILVGLGFGATALASTRLGYAGSIAIWTLGEIVMAGAGPAVVADLAPVQARGTYQGMFQMSWGVGMLLAPVLGTWLLAAHGPLLLWTACLGVGLAAAAGHLLIAGARDRRMAELRPSSPVAPTGQTALP